MINAGEFGMWIANKGCKITNKSLKSKNKKSWYVGQQHRQPKIHMCMILQKLNELSLRQYLDVQPDTK